MDVGKQLLSGESKFKKALQFNNSLYAAISIVSLTCIVLCLITVHYLGLALALAYICLAFYYGIKTYRDSRALRIADLPIVCPKLGNLPYKILKVIFSIGLIGLLGFTVIAAVNIASNPNWSSFPGECEGNAGCTRVATNPIASELYNEGKISFEVEAAVLKRQIRDWVTDQTESKITLSNDTLLIGQSTSVVLGFVEDIAIQLIPCSSSASSTYTVFTQAQQRIGITPTAGLVGDLYDYLQKQNEGKTELRCT
mmetsp:Transcript_49110/g.56461  ORF Transcript_49110/g.56461 Transcript_49110/m.56461 type:complete len:254 (-) Transcript_49110:294-1055(-)